MYLRPFEHRTNFLPCSCQRGFTSQDFHLPQTFYCDVSRPYGVSLQNLHHLSCLGIFFWTLVQKGNKDPLLKTLTFYHYLHGWSVTGYYHRHKRFDILWYVYVLCLQEEEHRGFKTHRRKKRRREGSKSLHRKGWLKWRGTGKGRKRIMCLLTERPVTRDTVNRLFQESSVYEVKTVVVVLEKIKRLFSGEDGGRTFPWPWKERHRETGRVE